MSEIDLPVSSRMIQIFLLVTVLSIAPAILLTITCFTRFVVAFSFLRTGLGLQSTPANLLLITLSLFMTSFIMAPTFERAWKDGIAPLLEQKVTQSEAIPIIVEPFREFMLTQVRDKDLKLFADISRRSVQIAEDQPVAMQILVPAFMISELRRGFEIGLLIILPFMIIDLIVATLVMSMGMMMMPPSVISLPIKVLFFVLIDGWNVLVGSLLRSFG